MLMLFSLMMVLGNPLQVQAQTRLSGRWIVEDTRMHPGGEAVTSALGAERLPHMARQPKMRELVIDEGAEAIAVEQPGEASRVSLSLSGVEVTTKDSSGAKITARALRDGAAVLIRHEHQVSLLGTLAVIEVEERYELLPDGTLRVDTTARCGTSVTTSQSVYRKAVR
jgi:hypothetical protein